jgi:bifunctional DNA-binding transcriptional regulator/antitoxin component of YhaV-PrlF toxin-antitoxin module
MMKLQYMAAVKQYKIIARVLDNGKITIPLDVRRYMDLKKGDYVEAVITKLDMSVPEETKA